MRLTQVAHSSKHWDLNQEWELVHTLNWRIIETLKLDGLAREEPRVKSRSGPLMHAGTSGWWTELSMQWSARRVLQMNRSRGARPLIVSFRRHAAVLSVDLAGTPLPTGRKT